MGVPINSLHPHYFLEGDQVASFHVVYMILQTLNHSWSSLDGEEGGREGREGGRKEGGKEGRRKERKKEGEKGMEGESKR